jgi:hypothetical protein
VTQLGDIRRGLRTIFDALSGISVATADSPDQPWTAPDYSTGAQVNFKIIGMKNAGRDGVRMAYDELATVPGDLYEDAEGNSIGAFVVEVVGNRVLTVSVRVECEDHDDDATAWPFAEAIRAGLKRPSVLSSLQDLGLGIARVSDLRDLSYTEKDERRVVSVAQFDLVLNAASNITDDNITTIESLEITPTINGIDLPLVTIP